MDKKPIPVRFSEATYRELKIFAVINGLTINDAIQKLLSDKKMEETK